MDKEKKSEMNKKKKSEKEAPVYNSKNDSLACEIYDWAETFITALVFVVLIFTFIFRIVTVDGQSMMQTLHDKEKLLISSIEYKPTMGDIIVLQKEDRYPYPLVKRVIATEGQTVDINTETWTVTVDGVKLDEPYVNFENGVPMNYGVVEFPYTVSEGCVFVMGDNRNHSSDSRYFGEIDKRKILGKLLVRLFPINKFGKVQPVNS